MKECGKAMMRRLRDPNFIGRYFVGQGIDIGGAPDPLSDYAELLPLMKQCDIWDIKDGDAQLMQGVKDDTYDFVHSSHCLEHLVDPRVAIERWWQLIRPGGYLVLTVPDEDLYEQGHWPSKFNHDHKWTFTIFKAAGVSWSERSLNLLELLTSLDGAQIHKVELLDHQHRYDLGSFDQTLTPVGEAAIETVARKATVDDSNQGGRLSRQVPPSAQDQVRMKVTRTAIDTDTIES